MTILFTLYFFLFAKHEKTEAFGGYLVSGIAFDAFIMAAIALQLAMK
jgi:hypothetical protein